MCVGVRSWKRNKSFGNVIQTHTNVIIKKLFFLHCILYNVQRLSPGLGSNKP